MNVNEKLRQYLIEVAKRRKTTTYGAAAPIAGVPNPQLLNTFLDEINRYEDGRSGLLLSAVVTHDHVNGDGLPGIGFWMSALSLGRTIEGDWVEFWETERNKVWDYPWGDIPSS